MNILAVIVNYRTAEMTMRSVKALASALEVYPLARTVVVDNDSKDGSVEKLRSDIDEAGLQKRAQVFSSPWNGGFAWGNNCAIRDALDGPDSPDYVYLLNSDAFPEKTALDLVERRIGAVALLHQELSNAAADEKIALDRYIEKLAQLAGHGWARAVLLAAETIDADEALRTGFAQRAGSIDDAVRWAHEIARLAPLSIAGQKLALDRLVGRTVDADDVRDAFDRVWTSADRLEGIAAFREKRPPQFEGC